MRFLRKVLVHLPSTGNGRRGLGASRAQKEWGRNNDTQYLLRALEHTVLRFCIATARTPGQAANLTPGELAVLDFLRRHPGATARELASGLPPQQQFPSEETRQTLVRLVDSGVLRPCGRVPLEAVDPRYERVLTCAVCGSPSKSHKTQFWKYNTPVVRCDTCGLYYANPRWKSEHLFGRYTPE
ncbi:MAG: hypothetical protein M3328_12215, partial [Chloroflexota bacterium]|nr:hypothetical protein [Chloroflexota bacterium]